MGNYTDDGTKRRKHPDEVNLSYIPKFEKIENMAINVFGWDNEEKMVIIHFISKQPATMERVNLMLIEREENRHYTFIQNFNGMLYDQTKHKE